MRDYTSELLRPTYLCKECGIPSRHLYRELCVACAEQERRFKAAAWTVVAILGLAALVAWVVEHS